MIRFIFPIALVAFGTVACGRNDPAPDQDSGSQVTPTPLAEGEAYLAVPGGRIWYRQTGSGAGTPVILLHGGPGFSSYYLKPLEALGSDRLVIRYDQLGAGKSDHVTDTTLFNIGHFVRELDSLRAALGYENVHLLGHSWGTILAVEYYRVHPERVVSLTLASAALDIPRWEENARRLVRTLSDSAQRAIAAAEATGRFDTPAWERALEEFYGRYVWRTPVAADLDSLFQTANEGIYGYMWGPSEFVATGTLKPYNATPFLGAVTVPTLYTVGEFDESDPETIRRHAAMTPGATAVVIPDAAHLTTWDNPEAMLTAVRSFLASVDAGTTSAARRYRP